MRLSSQDAFQLSKSLRELSVSLGNYRYAKWAQLTSKQRKEIEDAEWSLLNASSDIRTAAVGLVLDETDISFKKFQQVTSDAKKTVEKLEDIRKVLNIATAGISFAGAVVSRDTGAAIKTAKGLYDAIT